MIGLALLLLVLGLGMARLMILSFASAAPSGLIVNNFRGSQLPAIGGVVIVASFLACEAVLALLALVRPLSLEPRGHLLSASAVPRTFLSFDHLGLLALILGFFMLGAIDDLAGAGRARGLSGHFRSLLRGTVTGGAIKALGGLALALVVSGVFELNLAAALLDTLIIALTANLMNLLDLRPGRTAKAYLVFWIPIAAFSADQPWLALSAMVTGGVVGWLPFDLRERGMLGDSGANMLGAVLGAGVVLLTNIKARLGILVVLFVITLISERWSLTSIIAKSPPLRWFDRIGRMEPFED